MELIFEHTTNLGSGVNPAAVHQADDSLCLLLQRAGVLTALQYKPGGVGYDTPALAEMPITIPEKEIHGLVLVGIPRFGVFGAWEVPGQFITKIGYWRNL